MSYEALEADWRQRPTPESLQQLMQEAEKRRAEVAAHLLRTAGRKLAMLLRSITRPMAEALERAQMRDELGAMSDRELMDIGLSRCDIPAVIAGSYREARGERSRAKPLLVRHNPGPRRAEAVGRIKLAS